MIVKKNLYGGPASGRNWGKLRDYSLLCVFNDTNHRKSLEYIMKKDQVQLSDRSLEVINSGGTKGWRCKQCEMDPCLFILISPEGRYLIAMIHKDDIDAIAERDEDLDFVFAILDRIWKIKMVDAAYVLGVNRRMIIDSYGNLDAVELNMTRYICQWKAQC